MAERLDTHVIVFSVSKSSNTGLKEGASWCAQFSSQKLSVLLTKLKIILKCDQSRRLARIERVELMSKERAAKIDDFELSTFRPRIVRSVRSWGEPQTRMRKKPSKRLVQHGSTSKCCSKRSFRSRDQVKEAVTKNRYTRNRLRAEGLTIHRMEDRYYKCPNPNCGYHLTSKPLYTNQGGNTDVA